LEEFLLTAVGISAADREQYEILWVRETKEYGREEVVLDNEDAWEYLKEDVGEKRVKEVRINIVRKENAEEE